MVHSCARADRADNPTGRRAQSAEQRFQLLMNLTDRLAELIDSEG
jgi:hypothetical protein